MHAGDMDTELLKSFIDWAGSAIYGSTNPSIWPTRHRWDQSHACPAEDTDLLKSVSEQAETTTPLDSKPPLA